MAEVPGTLEGWYAIHDFRRRNAVRVLQLRIEHNPILLFGQIFADDAPHRGMAEPFPQVGVKVGAPDRIILAPWI